MEKFVFEPPSDEEIDHNSESEHEEEGEEEAEAEASDDEVIVRKNQKTQSPWDFSHYTESLADEHSRRSTTSVDYKISKALERRPVVAAGDGDSEECSDSEPQIQVMLSNC